MRRFMELAVSRFTRGDGAGEGREGTGGKATLSRDDQFGVTKENRENWSYLVVIYFL